MPASPAPAPYAPHSSIALSHAHHTRSDADTIVDTKAMVPKTFQFHDYFLPVCVLSGRMRRAPVTILATRQKRIILRGAKAQLLNAPAPISGHDDTLRSLMSRIC